MVVRDFLQIQSTRTRRSYILAQKHMRLRAGTISNCAAPCSALSLGIARERALGAHGSLWGASTGALGRRRAALLAPEVHCRGY
jgi:hypothetical protein